MSTISSQLLVSSSSLTEDFYKIFIRKSASQKELVLISRISVMLVSIVAILLALAPDNNVLSLVSNAWAGFGAAFGPVVLLSLYWKGLTRDGALAGMIVGAVTVLIWLYAPITIGGDSLSSWIYEIIPGFTLSMIAAVGVSLMGRDQNPEVDNLFGELVAAMNPKG